MPTDTLENDLKCEIGPSFPSLIRPYPHTPPFLSPPPSPPYPSPTPPPTSPFQPLPITPLELHTTLAPLSPSSSTVRNLSSYPHSTPPFRRKGGKDFTRVPSSQQMPDLQPLPEIAADRCAFRVGKCQVDATLHQSRLPLSSRKVETAS